MAVPKEPGYEFIHRVWPFISEKQFCNSRKHYARLLDRVGKEVDSIRENLDIFALRIPEDIFDVVQRLVESETLTRDLAFEAVQKETSSSPYTEDRILRTLRSAIYLWLTIGLDPQIRQTGRPLTWDSGHTLTDKMTSHFNNDVSGIEPPELVERQLQEDLSAASLCDHYGFSIYWTHNLSEHLTIDWKHKILTVYEDKIVAYNHVRAGTASLPVPDQLFEETIDTLNLLFPFQNKPTKKLLEKHDVAFYGLGLCGRPRKLLLNDYHYWRGRIADIHQVFLGPSIGIQQLLLDEEGKNFIPTFTFWVAVAAGVVALLGMGLAIASLVYSIKQYELGLKQYEVSMVQACGDSYVRAKMPKLCSGQK